MDQGSGRRPPQRKGTVLGIGLALLVTVGLSGALHARFALGDKPAPRVPLTVAAVPYELQEAYQRQVSYLGLVAAGRKADLGFEVAGRIADLPWREGSPVAAGEIIARLDDDALQASYRATAADLAQVRSELELARLKARRQQDLRETGAVSREAHDETRLRARALASRVDAVTARLERLQIELDNSALRAPYDGLIADRYVHEGAVISPGTPVVRFIETAGREAHIGVAVARARTLTPGQEYRLSLRDRDFSARLLSVRPDVDPVTRVTTAVFAIPEGMDAVDGEPVTLLLDETVVATGGWLPIAALLEGSRGLWTVLRLSEADGRTVTVREVVKVLEVRDDRAYVHGSLPPGSRVVASGVHRITPGTPVTVAEAG